MYHDEIRVMRLLKLVVLSCVWVACISAQVTVTGIKIHADPAARVQPLETIALQVRVYGEAGGQSGRVRQDGAGLKVLDPDGGWISKPYNYQGEDNEDFVDRYQSRAGRIFGQLTGEYVLQDAAVYTAPEKPGRYRVEATLSGQSATLEIEVTPDAPLYREPEEFQFPPEPASTDPYRDLAEHWAPMIAQETWWQHKADYLARFDYDGDWKGGNNWEDLEIGSSQAYVHYAAMETATHWFLLYNFYHPRDYSDKCVAGSCHENDNEGLVLTIAKDGSTYGRLLAMETLAHNNIYSFRADRSVRAGEHNIDGDVEFHDGHPVVFIESGGHGVYGTRSVHARYDVANNQFTEGTGVTYIYKNVAERPKYGNDREVGYDLLSIQQEWWSRAGDTGMFDDFFTYVPAGGRPVAAYVPLPGAFYGRAQGTNMAKPFWGWHDNRTRKKGTLAVGQWGLDPAYAEANNLSFSGRFSTDYVFNPYLALNGRPQQAPAPGSDVSRATRISSSPETPASAQPISARRATASRVQSGSGHAAASDLTPAIDLTPAVDSAGDDGSFEVTAWVDGIAEIDIQGSRATITNIQGVEPSILDIPNPPMPMDELGTLELNVHLGRGAVRLVQRPAAANNYTTRIRIEDPARAGTTYSLVLDWKR